MNFFSYVDCAPLSFVQENQTVVTPPPVAPAGDFGVEETTTLDFPENDIQPKTSPSQPEDEPDSLSFDFEDDFAFDEPEPVAEEPKSISSDSGTIDSEVDISFGDESDEMTLDMDGSMDEDKGAPMGEADTTDGEIDFDFDLGPTETVKDAEDSSLMDQSEDAIATGSYDSDDLNIPEERDDVTAELERSVTALVDSIEIEEESSDADNITNTSELENLDLDLNLEDLDDK